MLENERQKKKNDQEYSEETEEGENVLVKKKRNIEVEKY